MTCAQDLKGVVKELLMEFYLCNSKMKPEKLVFYRDGVSEGQFETVQRLEIPQVSTSDLASELEVKTQSLEIQRGHLESLLILVQDA